MYDLCQVSHQTDEVEAKKESCLCLHLTKVFAQGICLVYSKSLQESIYTNNLNSGVTLRCNLTDSF